MDLANHPEFRAANVHTGFIEEQFDTLFPPMKVHEIELCQAAVALILNELNAAKINSIRKNDPFVAASGLRLNHDLIRQFNLKFQVGEELEDFNVRVKYVDGAFEVKINDGEWLKTKGEIVESNNRFSLKCSVNGHISNYSAVISPESITLFNDEGKTQLDFVQPKFLTADHDSGASGSRIISPMPGVLEKLFVKPGDTVKKGDSLAVIIAMKMEHVLKAPRDAVIKSVGGNAGENMAKGQTVIAFEEEAQ